MTLTSPQYTTTLAIVRARYTCYLFNCLYMCVSVRCNHQYPTPHPILAKVTDTATTCYLGIQNITDKPRSAINPLF